MIRVFVVIAVLVYYNGICSSPIQPNVVTSDPDLAPAGRLGDETVLFNGTLNDTHYVEPLIAGLHYRGYQLTYDVTYWDNGCTPIFRLHYTWSIIEEWQCFPDRYTENMYVTKTNRVVLTPGNSGCVATSKEDGSNNGTQYRCTGKLAMLYSQYKMWNVSIGCFCGEVSAGLKLNVLYNLYFNELYESEPIPMNLHPCKDILNYDTYVLPNIFGQESVKDVKNTATYLSVMLDGLRCYKHFKSFVCRFSFPNYVNGRIHYPCTRTCEDLLAGCSDILIQRFGIYMSCGWMVDSYDPDKCYYEPVICVRPDAPSNGFFVYSEHWNSTIRYSAGEQVRFACNSGYEPNPPDGNITCSWMGQWPQNYGCQPIMETQILNTSKVHISDDTHGINLIPVVVGLGSTVLVITIICVIILYIVSIKRKNSLSRSDEFILPAVLSKVPESYRFDIFVSYCDADSAFVYRGEDCFRLKLEGQGYLICLHGRDFLPGNAIEINIVGAVEQSKSIICLISRHFLNSEWCRFEFDLFRHQMRKNPKFKLFVILVDGEDTLSETEGLVWGYAQNYVYLSALDEHFDEKLFHALPDAVCAGEQDIVPGRVHPVITDHIM